MRKLLVMSFLFSLVSFVQATEPQKVNFQDLQGQVAPYEDPFTELSEEQLYNLSIYARITEMQKTSPERVTEAMKNEAVNSKQQLINEQVDIDYLFAQRLIIMEKRKAAAMSANEKLHNKRIEMGGYMLALEFDKGLVTEFLLVPTVGACSHKPVPAANQLIYVKVKKPIKAGSAYMPIKITGTLEINLQGKELYLVDGKKNIDMSYSMSDATVSPYF